jgi:hypothetical protein
LNRSTKRVFYDLQNLRPVPRVFRKRAGGRNASS